MRQALDKKQTKRSSVNGSVIISGVPQPGGKMVRSKSTPRSPNRKGCQKYGGVRKKTTKKTKTNMNDGQERSHEWNLYQMIQAKWPFDSRWLEVAFSPLKGSLNHPQKVRIARYLLFKNYIGDFVMFGGSLFLGSVLFSTCRWDEMEGKLSKWRKDDGASEPCKIPWK